MADAIVVKYQGDVKDLVNALNKVEKENLTIEKGSKKASKTMEDSYKKASSSIVSGLKNVALAAGVAFGTQQLVAFGKEAVQVAAKAEGVERAFNKLNRANLLDELRRATRGTVSDLDLMQQAVRANNFQVPLEKLASFFEFATKRSIETGESVDYLVQSIVDGIGRKSTLVLDNLGISAAQLQEEIKRTGDFGEAAANIIEQSLEETGEVADTTAVKLAQLNVIGEKLQQTFGEFLINLGTGFAFLAGQTQSLDVTLTANEKAAKKLAKAYGDDLEGAVDAMVKKNEELLANQLKIAELEETRSYQNSRVAIANINESIQKIQERNEFLREYIKQLKNVYDEQTKVSEQTKNDYVRSIAQLNTELKGYNEELKNAEVGSTQFFNIVDKITFKTKELNEAIAQTNLADALKVDIEDDIDITGGVIEYGEEVARTTEIADELWSNHFNELMAAQDAAFENEERNREASRNALFTYMNEASNLFSAIMDISNNLVEQEIENLRLRFEAGEITREEFEQERKSLLRQQAEDQKSAALFQATVDGIGAVVNAYSQGGPILAAIVGAAVAAEIAALASAPVPQFAKGVIDLKGEGTGTSDSISAKLSKGESVMTAEETIKHKKLFEAIRANKYDDYIYKNEVYPMIDQILNSKGFESMGASYKINGGLSPKDFYKGTDRLRQSNGRLLSSIDRRLEKMTRTRKRGGFA